LVDVFGAACPHESRRDAIGRRDGPSGRS